MAMAYARWAMVVVLCMWVGAGEGATDCTSALASVTGCSTFLTNPSSTPDQKGCCAPLQTVLSSPASFQCICAQATSSDNPLLKNALLLPKACKLDINVSADNCTSSPPASPGTTSPPTPKSSTTPAAPSGANLRSAGFMSVSAFSALVAAVLLYAMAPLFH